jgi:predicted metal-dependent hydrolase
MIRDDSIRIIEFKEIGKVSFFRRPAARNLRITIKPFNEVHVSVPLFVSFEKALGFVEEKHQWIRRSQARLGRYDKSLTIFDEHTVFHTLDHVLIMGRHAKNTIQTIIKDGQIMIMFPQHADVRDPRIQKAVRKAIQVAWRLEAGIHLPARVKELAEKFRFQFGSLSFRNNSTRWGSCSRTNNIILNIHLMRLPHHLCDYVILHELVHTVHKHHQKAFWQLLNTVTGGRAKMMDKELNGYCPEIW